MTSKITEIFNYMRECPQLSDLWSIAGTEDIGNKVILPQGASSKRQYQDKIDVCGDYHCEIVPYATIYEDYQINCFAYYDTKDSSAPEKNVNVLEFNEVQAICDWVENNAENGNLPEITGHKVVAVECNPYIPQIRYVNPEENTIGYFITIRIYYVNTAKRKTVDFIGD